ncbi:MAG: dephospho-CoA kinase [Candidatus Latescibacterota bacterium]
MILGVTGGMGVGKSALSRYFVTLGARSLDADRVAHDLLEAGAGRASLCACFGADIEDKNGQLDRRLLGRRALASKSSLQKLYAIVRPSLEAELRSRLGTLSKESPPNIVVFDAPLLYEWGIDAWTDCVVVVYADREIRIERIMRRSGLSRIEIERRMALQMDEDEKRERADFTVNNSDDLNALHQQAVTLWAQITGAPL